MFTLDEIRAALADRNLRDVARQCGLHYNVVYRAATERAKNPSYETVKALSDYLKGDEA